MLVRNIMLSCDPTQRGWIAFDTYLPAVKIGEVVRSLGAGGLRVQKCRLRGRRHRVRACRLAGLCRDEPQGPTQQAAAGNAAGTGDERVRRDPNHRDFGLLEWAGRCPEKRSSCPARLARRLGGWEIAKIRGCRVIGIAGGPEKCRWVTDEARFDAAIDYKSENVRRG